MRLTGLLYIVLHERKQCVSVNGHASDYFEVS